MEKIIGIIVSICIICVNSNSSESYEISDTEVIKIIIEPNGNAYKFIKAESIKADFNNYRRNLNEKNNIGKSDLRKRVLSGQDILGIGIIITFITISVSLFILDNSIPTFNFPL